MRPEGEEYVDLLAQFAKQHWAHAGFDGDVQQTIDTRLRKRVFTLRGSVTAANCMSLPRIGRPPLGLRQRFLYLQVKLVGQGKPFALHLDLMTSERSVVRLSFNGRCTEAKRCGKVVQLPCSQLLATAGHWTVVGIDLPALLRLHTANQCGDFHSLRGMVACCNMVRLVRAAKTIPKDLL